VANALTIGQALGALNLGRDIMCNEDLGVRICGVFGHANETAAFVAALLPAYIAVAESSAGARRLFWIGCMAPTATMLILTSSRGAIVGLVAGSLWAGVLCRRYLSAQRFVSWLSVTAATMVPMLLLVGWKYWHLMLGRWTEGTSVSAYSMTSGRSDIWQGYLMKMLQFPWTFITGFGWNAHSVMSFTYVPHNQYLTLWFTIGLVGIIGFIAIFRKVVTTAMAAARAAIPQSDARRQIVAGIFGTLILGVAVFFGTMYIIWQFWWIYAGLVMRYSVLVLEARSRLPANHPRELATRRSTLTAAQPASRRGM
jgi:O-antigen ligase